MTQSSTFRRFKRRIGQMARRSKSGPGLEARQVTAEVMEFLSDLRRAAEKETEVAIELALSLLETLPQLFMTMDDKLGLLPGAIDRVPELVTELLNEDVEDPASVVDRFDVFERLFCFWVADDSGFLQGIDESLLAALTTRDDEDLLIRICREHLRHIPLVFPEPAGSKLDLERSILQADRHRVERLLGEIYARRGHFDYSVIVSSAHHRATGDAVDFVSALARSGREEDALEVARRVLRNPGAPRHAALKEVFETMVARREGSRRAIAEQRKAFLAAPDLEGFAALKEVVAEDEWDSVRRQVIGAIEKRGDDPELALRLYLGESMIVEADGLVVTKSVDAYVLAECADQIIEEHTDRAAGWLLLSAHHIMKRAREPQYRQAGTWLLSVRRASEATGQIPAFDRVLSDFRERYRRRRLLLRVLDEMGLGD